jgi:hypothetical protein
MSRFLRLSTKIINTRYIETIDILPKLYKISFASKKYDGYIIFGSGGVDMMEHEVEISEEKEPNDYAAVTEWINNQK